MPKENEARFTVRLPQEVYSTLKTTSNLEGKPMNTLIIDALKSRAGNTFIQNQFNVQGDVHVYNRPNPPPTIDI